MNFKKILSHKRIAHKANLKRIAENYILLKKRVAKIKADFPESIDFVECDKGSLISFWFHKDEECILDLCSGPFGFATDGKYKNLDAAISELAKWIAENE